MPVILFSLISAIAVNLAIGYDTLADTFLNSSENLSYSLLALFILYTSGLFDDIRRLRYGTKLIIQLLCGTILLLGGIKINILNGFTDMEQLPQWAEGGITILFTMLIVNAINFIDGIDGLAAGISAIALCFFSSLLFSHGIYEYAITAAATLGVTVSFFYFNVYGNPSRYRKTFMGDTGSLTLGLILTCLTSKTLTLPANDGILPFTHNIATVLSPLVIPVLDVARVFIERIGSRCNPFKPDRRHIHHLLLDCGASSRAAMRLILLLSILFIAVNMLLAANLDTIGIILLDMILYITITTAMHLKARIKPDPSPGSTPVATSPANR